MAWSSKPVWTAAQWREYRRSKGTPDKKDLPTIIPIRITEQGRELCAMMRTPALDWPTGLFVAEAKFAPKKVDTSKCACGCGIHHQHAVSRVVGESGSRYVLWYINMAHRNKHAGVVT